ncbi:MAG: hypothetical protein QGG40_20610, partial [Myxococcota bacterium]|nr:hypothetical protein [Myxococcota bacterium]
LVSTLCSMFALLPNIAHGSQLSFGMSDSLGVYGVGSLTFPIDQVHEDLFIVVGSTLFVLGGGGIGWQHYFSEGPISPFATVTGFAAYTLPMMCVTDDCSIYVAPFLGAAGGVEFRTQRPDTTNFHLQLGVYSSYDLREGEVLESPSDKPLIWPLLNVGMSF